MARGAPDYGIYAPKTVTAVMSDMGELAVRLGSIVSYDRRGDVVHLDDFEAPVIKWLDTADGVQTVTLDNTSFRSGAQSLKLHNKAVAGLGVGIAKSFKKLGSPRLGIEISFSNPPGTCYYLHKLYDYDGTYYRQANAKLDFSGKVIQVYDHSLGYVTIEDYFRVFEENFCFTPAKLVVDFETGKYVKLLLGNVEYDLSDYTIPFTGSTATPREIVTLDLGNDATATAADMYLDDFILTQNEP